MAAVGAAAFAVHVALVALYWPIPPIHGSYSVPLYLLGNLSVLVVAGAVWRGGPGLLGPWLESAGSPRWRVAVLAGILATVGGALLLRAAAPDTYFAFWREEGVFEPLTLFCYAAGAGLLWSVAPEGPDRRPWRLAALFLLLLALEEIDYFGIFGGMIGRIEGEYAGSLHDLIRLTALGIAGTGAWIVIGALAVAIALLLWRTGWIDPRWIAARLTSPAATWLLLAAAFLAAAAIEEAGLFGVRAAKPTPEEAIELGGGLSLAAWALESAAGIRRGAAP